MSRLLVALAVAITAFGAQLITLDSIAAEPDLERRSRLAVEFAQGQVDVALFAYQAADAEAARAALAKIPEAVDISQAALSQTGKHARKKPKHFKRAEIETRKLLEDLKDAQRQLNFDERPDLDPIIKHVDAVNRQLLLAIMQKK